MMWVKSNLLDQLTKLKKKKKKKRKKKKKKKTTLSSGNKHVEASQ